jgi:hypothetical protein
MVFKILSIAAITGLSTSSAIILGYGMTLVSPNNSSLDWRDIAVMGGIGTMIGAHYSVTGLSWFNRGY